MPEGGCSGENEWVEGVISDCCPVVYLSEYSIVFETVRWLERGVLPYSGGWMEQPARLMDMVAVVHDEESKFMRKQQEQLNGGKR
jgi:hypothetical protein